MKKIKNFLIFLILSIYLFSVNCDDVEIEDSDHIQYSTTPSPDEKSKKDI
jgi:hypothetical protein